MAAQDEREEREHYAEKHATFRRDMNRALRSIRVAAFLRNRPDADRYVLAEYKWPFK